MTRRSALVMAVIAALVAISFSVWVSRPRISLETSQGSMMLREGGEHRQLALEAKPKDLLSDPDRYDGKFVTIKGTAIRIRARVSQKGNPYHTFVLAEAESLTIFSFGKPSCQEGSPITVEGAFYKVKRQGRYTFRNQVDANTVNCQ